MPELGVPSLLPVSGGAEGLALRFMSLLPNTPSNRGVGEGLAAYAHIGQATKLPLIYHVILNLGQQNS